MNIAVVGTGYVGLVSGACFSDVGVDVTCIDIDENKIINLQNGIIPIYEPGLKELVTRNSLAGRLHFTTDLVKCLDNIDILFLAVGTPPMEDGSADLSHVLNVSATVGKYLNKYILIVNKSTVPVGTARLIKETISSEMTVRARSVKFDVASNPEFLKEGSAIKDFMSPDRIIVGTDSENAREMLDRLYRPFMMNNYRLIHMDIQSAEMTKYASNAMLATRISFMNDIANLCSLVGADVHLVRKGIGSDSRIGNKFLYPGVGYGGSCFPKDVKALIKTASSFGYRMKVLEAVEEVNESQKKVLFEKLSSHFNGNIKGLKIAVWGLAFKPETDDVREAPSLVLIEMLRKAGVEVAVYDPVAMDEFRRRGYDDISYTRDMYEACIDASAIMLVTEWKEFRIPSWAALKKLMKEPIVFDGRNIYDREELKNNGFIHYCI
jgi:UDPglucose 6-dehydrogenase